MRLIDKIALIELKDGKVLSTRSKGKDVYYFPGGKRDGEETDEETLIREVKEELDVAVKPESIEYYGKFEAQAHGKEEGILVQMTCYTAKYEGELKPSSEIEEIVWLTYRDREKSSPVDQIIFEDLYQKGLIAD
ncbi:MAG: NUDIX domain-containing protein [Clostridia bacterium]|nr:NUDIX domain-containing protein [Clostridia bacterium]